MLNKLSRFFRAQQLAPGSTLICAVSGGADSMALLFGMYLLREKLQLKVEAAHFNHNLRPGECDRDEAHVRSFCVGYGIPLHAGSAMVVQGKKGLEAAAREARYRFFDTLPGYVATAHTANDNAETVLLHLIRGTGLKGLGGIAPVRGRILRPMLDVTRDEVLAFLTEYSVPFIHDSSNDSDAFLRNRIRSRVMPLLYRENPRLAQSLSSMALHLREDEAALESLTPSAEALSVAHLRTLPPALRSRALANFLRQSGVREPEKAHIALAESLVFSDNPSARAGFPGGVTIGREYDRLTPVEADVSIPVTPLPCPGSVELPGVGLRVTCSPATALESTPTCFTVPSGTGLYIRSRLSGDRLSLSGGSKSLKKLMIDRKIPAAQRPAIPVVCDESGIVGVYGIGADALRAPKDLPAVQVYFEPVPEQRNAVNKHTESATEEP